MKRLSCVVAGALAAVFAGGARASLYSDLWFDPAESGWGMNVAQQGESAFVTLFVYDADGRPAWYVASDARITAYANPGGYPVFTGSLYRMSGPWHGGAFDPAQVHAQRAGDVQVEALDAGRVRLHYVADGVSHVRELRRQTFAKAPLGGTYAGQFSLRVSRGDPAPPQVVRYAARIVADFDDTGAGRLRADEADGRTCEFRGPYAQSGKLVRFAGSYACNGGEAAAGTFTIDDLEVTGNGLTGSLRMTSGSMLQYGRFAGARY